MRTIFAEATDEENPSVVVPFRGLRESQIAATLGELKADYDLQLRSFQLVEIAGGWRLVSRPEFAPWLKKLLDETRPHRLSPPALETLSIIALRQPIARADIAAIRGVEVDGVIKTLLEHDLITIVGRSEVPGKPMLYGTTAKFLEHFGLRSLDDMPKAAELRLQAAALKTAEEKAAKGKAAEETTAAAASPKETTTAPAPATVPPGQTTTAAEPEKIADEGQTPADPQPH